MKADEQISLLDNLQVLLETQIEMALKGNFRRVEALAEQADSVVEKIVRTKAFEQSGSEGQRKNLAELYKKLELILAAGKASIGKQLRQMGNVRKTLKVYRNSN